MDLRSLFAYEPETGLLRWLRSHGSSRAGAIAGHLDRDGYIRIGSRHLAAHRVAWLLMTGRAPVGEVDHINGVRHDNRWANLRLATKAQNAVNRAARNTTGFKGVAKVGDRFQAQIKVAGKNLYLGLHATAEQAHEVYRAASLRHFGAIDRVCQS